ncbi:thiol reductant ABC exporter subunit CydD [Ancylobacter sp. VNQ12]|uniref:thiol reductant ABC exporter subunit CydD n=1 Tax=Ancylobacter sp. VNQ12 TaxID=3400920 RepID=UPI003C07D0B9
MVDVSILPAATGKPAAEASARKAASPAARALRLASLLQSLASLLWAPQAALLSYAVAGMATGSGVREAVLPAVGIVAFGLLRALCDAAGSRMAFRAARDELSRLRAAAAESLARRSPLDIARPASGLAASVLAEQAETVVPYLSRFQPARMRAVVVPLVLLGCIVPFSWAAGLVLAVAAPLIPLFMALIGLGAKAASEEQLVELGGMNAFLLDRLRGLATIRSLGAVDATARRLRADAESLRRRTMVVLRIAFLSSAVLELFSALGVAMVAGYIGFHLLGVFSFGSWGEPLGLGRGLFILLLAPAFFEPLRELSAVWHDRASGQAALAALSRLADEGARIVGADVPEAARSSAAPALDLHTVSFRHAGGGAAVFDGFDLHVVPGEHVALFAPSGAGKSTLLALLAGLARPEAGQVVIGGEVMTDANAGRLRARMAYVGQAPHIFAGTLAGNVTLHRDIGREGVTGALEAARLGDVAAMRGPAPIGEGGRGLSGGEALRLALARLAVDDHADIILADEPTAHLDSATAAEVSDALVELARGRTLVLATHDARLAARMDRIVYLGGEARA